MPSSRPVVEKEWKLKYRITGRRRFLLRKEPGVTQNGPTSPGAVMEGTEEMDMVDVQWTHEDGFPPDTIDMPFRSSQVDQIVNAVLENSIKAGIVSTEIADKIRAIKEETFRAPPYSDGICTLTVPVAERTSIGDQVNVRADVPNSVVMQILEEKRLTLAKSLGVEP